MTDKMRENMLLFGKFCVPQMFQVKTPPFHYEIASILHEKSIRRVNLIAPRGHGKSSLVGGIYPLHHLVFDPGTKFVVLVSKTEGHAIRLLETIKDILNYSEPFRSAFGYHGMMNARVWKSTEVVLDTGDMIMCRGTGQQVVGLKHLNQRPTLILVDDPEDMNNTKTDESMEFNLRWMLQSLIPSLDPQKGRVVVIGTPQHQRCIVETLARNAQWLTRRYDAEVSQGVSLWPEWYNWDRLQEEKHQAEEMGRISMYYREYRCKITGDDSQLFKEDQLRYWQGSVSHDKDKNSFLTIESLDNAPVHRKIPVQIFMGIDPASSVSRTADFSTIVPVAVDEEMNRYVLPYFRGRVTPMALADRIIEYYHMYNPVRTRIESTGYQEMLREYIRSKEYVPGLEIKEMPRSAKSVRLESMQPFFAIRKVFLQPQMREMVDEMLLYPRGEHDDLLDGLYYAMKSPFKPSHREKPEISMSEHFKHYIGLASLEDYEPIPVRREDLTRAPWKL